MLNGWFYYEYGLFVIVVAFFPLFFSLVCLVGVVEGSGRREVGDNCVVYGFVV